MRVIEQLVHHFWSRGALTREEVAYLVRHGFAREADLPGFGPDDDGAGDDKSPAGADAKARAAEELEDELTGRGAGRRKAGGKKKKPTGHNLAPAVEVLAAHLAAREPFPALLELGNRLTPCPTWQDAARAVGGAPPGPLEAALVGLLGAHPRALGELWFWFDLEPLFDWADDAANAGPVAESLSKLLRADTPARVGRLGQLLKAGKVQALLDLLPARRAFLNLLPALYRGHFARLGSWLVPPAGAAAGCWAALPWSFVLVYNARQGTADRPPPGYPLDPRTLPPATLRAALTAAVAHAPEAVRELLIHELGDRAGAHPVFARPLYCPPAWRV